MAVTHAKVSAKSDGADSSEVLASDWNANHTVAAGTVTLAMMADIATDSLIGRDTASSGVPENITLNGTLSMSAGALQRAALTGDVTASAGSNTTAIASDAVTYAKLQNVAANNTVLGRISGAGGNAEELTAANIKTILALAASEIAFTPTGAIAATDVQAAIAELLAERETTYFFSSTTPSAITTEADTPPPFRVYNRTGRTLTFLSASANATVGPSGSTSTIDVNVDGTTIMTGTKIVLADGSGAAATTTQTTFSTTTIAADHYLSVNIDSTGGGAMKNLLVQVVCKG